MVDGMFIAGRADERGALNMPARRDKRTGGWFFRATVKLADGTRKRIFGTPGVPGPYADLAQTKVGAQEAERRAIAAVMSGKTAAPPKTRTEVPTLAEFHKEFLRNYAAEHKPSEKRAKTRMLEGQLLPHFGKCRLDEITMDDVEAFVRIQRERCSRKTVNNRLSVLSSLLKYAAEKGIIPEPRLKLSLGGKPNKVEAVPIELVEKLLECADPLYRAVILLSVEAGLRAGEVRGLQWGDIRDGLLTIRRGLDSQTNEVILPKHDKSRIVPISPRLAATLAALPKRGIWVCCREDGSPLTYLVDHYRGLVRLYKKAGVSVPRSPVHALRHTFGTVSAAKGVPMPVLQELMGHAEVNTTRRYIDVNEKQKREAIILAFARGSHVAAETTKGSKPE